MLKNILFGSFVTISMIALSGCAGENGSAGKCDSGKTESTKKVETSKCDGAKKVETSKCNKGE